MDEMKFSTTCVRSRGFRVLGNLGQPAPAGEKAPVNVSGVIPTCENMNMPGGRRR